MTNGSGRDHRDPGATGGGQRRRSSLGRTIGVAVALTGLVWILQGLGILTVGKSFMIGDPTWVVIGAAFVAIGGFVVVRGSRRSDGDA